MVNATLQPYDYRLGTRCKKTIAKQQSKTSNKNCVECANYTVSYIHCDRSHRILPYAKGVIWASSII
jgi:hypothetical protein